jgi:beta-glucanase (GH16 family)
LGAVIDAAAAAVVVTAAVGLGPVVHHADAATNAPALGAMTWSDDFNGAAGGAPDAGKWTHETGGGGYGNQELEDYTNSTNNAALDGNGDLVITARKETPAGSSCWYGTCQYTSARLNTASHFTQAYRHFEARMKRPRGKGMWPAFWLLGDNIGSVGWPTSGEMDIMENVGKEPTAVHGSMHGPGYSGGNPLTGTYSGPTFADAFHTFAVDWAPDSVAFSVDGVQYERHTPAGFGGKCVDVAAANSANGTKVQLYTCNGTNAQKWTVRSDGTVRALGKCLDVAAANSANSTKVQLYDCNGTNAQKWTIGSDGTIRALGKCLDATGVSSADGTPLQIWNCSGGANQKWSIA